MRLWKLGSLEHKIVPTEAAIDKLAEIIDTANAGELTDIIWGPDITVEKVPDLDEDEIDFVEVAIPNDEAILQYLEEKFEEDIQYEALKAILGERQYQDDLGEDRTDGREKTIGDYLTLLRRYIAKADAAYADNPSDEQALHEVRKVAAIALNCMEHCGVRYREGYE